MSGAKEWVVVVGGCDSGCVGIAAVACVGSNGARRGRWLPCRVSQREEAACTPVQLLAGACCYLLMYGMLSLDRNMPTVWRCFIIHSVVHSSVVRSSSQ